MEKGGSRYWWLGGHSTSDLSPWLRSNISELDAKTKAMLRLIDVDADSFAGRAEMYYKKRPELVAMVEDLYRTYRSMAERFDLSRSNSLNRQTSLDTPTNIVAETREKSTNFYEEYLKMNVPETPEGPIHVPETPKESTYVEKHWTMDVPENPEKSIHEESCTMHAPEKPMHVTEIPDKPMHVPETPKESTHVEEPRTMDVPKNPEKSTCLHKKSSVIHVLEIPEKPMHVPETHKESTYVEEPRTMNVSKNTKKSIHEESCTMHAPEKPMHAHDEESWTMDVPEAQKKSTSKDKSWSYTSEIEESLESEVDDGEGEGNVRDSETVLKEMKEEMERLREENRVYKALVREKDEEKREAIRQLSLAVEMHKLESLKLKRCVSATTKQKDLSPKKKLWCPFECFR